MPEKRTLENDEVVKRQNGVVSRLKKNGMDQHTNVEQHHDEDEGMGEFEDDWEDDQEGDEEDGDIVIAPDSEDEGKYATSLNNFETLN